MLDPSGVVKGWAAERAATRLADLPDTDYCLSAGGDITCRTLDPDAPPWRVGIEDPHDPTRLVATEASVLARRHTRFFVSSGPAHSHWFRPSESVDFARELRSLGLPAELRLFPDRKGEWREQLDAGLSWAFPG